MAQLAPLAGTWRWGEAENQQIVVRLSKGTLFGQSPGDPLMRLVPVDAVTFVGLDTSNRFRFEGDTLTIQPPDREAIQARRVPSQ